MQRGGRRILAGSDDVFDISDRKVKVIEDVV